MDVVIQHLQVTVHILTQICTEDDMIIRPNVMYYLSFIT
jgi:hypothetical protein